MRVRISSSVIVGSLALAATAAAQDTTRTKPRSTSRIPISKEAPATPTPPRVDTVTVYKTDTVTTMRTDTLTVTRVDTVRTSAGEVVTVTTPPLALRRIGGFYLGVDGGAAVPQGDAFSTGQSTGWHIDVPFGWDPVGSPLGIRFAAGYSHFDTKNPFENTTMSNPQIWSGDADLKLRLPATSLYNHRIELYGVGGATYNRFKNLIQSNENGTITVGDQTGTTAGAFPTVVDESWHSAWGWNAGGGLQFGFGRTNLFVESRYVRFNRNGNLSQIPVVVGLSWY